MIDERLEPFIQSFDTESQIRLRADLERYSTSEQQWIFAENVQKERCLNVLALLDDWEKPFYERWWVCAKKMYNRLMQWIGLAAH